MQASEPTGLRERKKQQTRQHIAETARRLFTQRSFETVTVSEIARQADVAEQTVYNYFPTKEDLFFWRFESFEESLLAAIRDRERAETPLTAFRRWFLAQRGLLNQQPLSDELRAISRVIAESPALLAREQQIFARFTASLAHLLANEAGAPPDDVEAAVVANAVIGVQRTLVAHVRTQILAGAVNPRLARETRAHAERAIDRLQLGLGSYPHGAERPPD
jgi:AcrR family transcriptional regulator